MSGNRPHRERLTKRGNHRRVSPGRPSPTAAAPATASSSTADESAPVRGPAELRSPLPPAVSADSRGKPTSDVAHQGPGPLKPADVGTVAILIMALSSGFLIACAATSLRRRPARTTPRALQPKPEFHPAHHLDRSALGLWSDPVEPPVLADPMVLGWELGHPLGAGITGPGAHDFLRAVLVELLTADSARIQVIITRKELELLFEGAFDAALQQAFSPNLHVFDLLEDAITHLQLEITLADAERANPDITCGVPRTDVFTYWFATPGADADVVHPVMQRAEEHRIAGLMLGPWPHGRICVLETADRIARVRTASGTYRAVETAAPAEAVATLRSHAAKIRRDLP